MTRKAKYPKLYELWFVNVGGFTFIRHADGKLEEYTGGSKYEAAKVLRITPTSYPMYKNVIEVTIEE